MSRITAVKSSNVGFFQYDRLFQCAAVLIKGEFLEPNNQTKRLDNNKKISSKDKTKIKFAVGNGLLFWCHYIIPLAPDHGHLFHFNKAVLLGRAVQSRLS